MKTVFAKQQELKETWYLVDARDRVLGRLASQIAYLLRGKHLSTYTPHCDMRVFVVVINAEKVRLTGKKWKEKLYHYHSGWPRGLRSFTAEQLRQRKPEMLIKLAVKGMLGKTSLGRKQLGHLFVYTGEQHPHQAQNPSAVNLSEKFWESKIHG